jgi:hypothetical protein
MSVMPREARLDGGVDPGESVPAIAPGAILNSNVKGCDINLVPFPIPIDTLNYNSFQCGADQ